MWSDIYTCRVLHGWCSCVNEFDASSMENSTCVDTHKKLVSCSSSDFDNTIRQKNVEYVAYEMKSSMHVWHAYFMKERHIILDRLGLAKNAMEERHIILDRLGLAKRILGFRLE